MSIDLFLESQGQSAISCSQCIQLQCTRELRGRQTVQAKGKEANEGLLHYQRAAPQFRARPPARRRPGPRRPPGYNQLPSGGPSPPLRPERARQVNPRIHRQSTARTRIWRTPAEEAYGLTGCCRQLARGRASPPVYSMTSARADHVLMIMIIVCDSRHDKHRHPHVHCTWLWLSSRRLYREHAAAQSASSRLHPCTLRLDVPRCCRRLLPSSRPP